MQTFNIGCLHEGELEGKEGEGVFAKREHTFGISGNMAVITHLFCKHSGQ